MEDGNNDVILSVAQASDKDAKGEIEGRISKRKYRVLIGSVKKDGTHLIGKNRCIPLPLFRRNEEREVPIIGIRHFKAVNLIEVMLKINRPRQ